MDDNMQNPMGQTPVTPDPNMPPVQQPTEPSMPTPAPTPTDTTNTGVDEIKLPGEEVPAAPATETPAPDTNQPPTM